MNRKLAIILLVIFSSVSLFGCSVRGQAQIDAKYSKGASDNMYQYNNADGSYFVPYLGAYDAEQYPAKQLDAVFTREPVAVNGRVEGAWENAPASEICNVRRLTFNKLDTRGTLRALWDGPVLYLLIQVTESSVTHGAQPHKGAGSDNPPIPSDRDSVCIGLDLYNERTVYETDTCGLFNISADGELSYYVNQYISSLSSVFAPESPQFVNRLKEYAVCDTYDEQGNVTGYNVELAFNIEGLDADNGKEFAVEVQICDAAAGQRINNVFWSHEQDSLYAEPNHEHPLNVDWGAVTLTGRGDGDEFAASTWRLSEALRYLDSPAFQKGVYTEKSQKRLDKAVSTAQTCLRQAELGRYRKKDIDRSADALEQAIRGLRWADERYPDPAELEDRMTLPDPYRFFNSRRSVKSAADWPERRAEILDMAQFYEYGYKPGAPDESRLVHLQHFAPGDTEETMLWGFMPWTVEYDCHADRFEIQLRAGERTASLPFTVYLPDDTQLDAAGHAPGTVPVVLSFDGDNPVYRRAGFAVVALDQGSDGDVRTDEYAWGQRGGCFYQLYPYTRNGPEALNEVSSEMAAAWAATRTIDALESLGEAGGPYAQAIAELIDPAALAVTGFSINGKYAFVSAVFDERIDVCMPGASGASGLSPWRYVYTGQEHCWTGTPFDSGQEGYASTVAFGTETICNSIRHNRVREIALFERFLTRGHIYMHLPGAYGFGTRLPYDQTDLLATMAGRAVVLISTPNDYNNGSVADALSLEVVRSVYNNLGFDGDRLLKFNYRSVVAGAEPHGTDEEQIKRCAEYLDYYFYGNAMTPETKERLDTDPFALNICNGGTASPFDYYWGGFNTITGGTGGAAGRDGWYYRKLEKDGD